MKNRIQHSVRFISAGLCLLLSLLANHAGAAVNYWDPEGTWAAIPPAYTGDLSGTWETAKWSTSSGGQASGVAWPETGIAACFAVGAGNGTPAFTMTMTNNHTVAGIADGSLSTPKACNVTINGPGIMTLPATAPVVFNIANASDGSLGLVTINAVIAGSGSELAVLGSGQLFLHGANTFTGGTLLGYSGGSFTGTLNFNNTGAFGTGSIIISNTSSGIATMALEGSSALTITNAVTVPASTAANLNIVGNPAGLTFSGPWTLNSSATIGSGGAANKLVIISGVMSGSGGLTASVSATPGILELTATNTYTGTTTVTNGILQLGDGVARNGSVAGTIAITSPGSLVFANPTALTFSKVISGTGPVTYQGPGILTLSGVSTYSGATTISAGTVKLGVANALPNGTGQGDVSLAGTLDLATFACSVNGLNGAGIVDNSTGTGTYTLTAGNNNATSTFSGIIKNTSGTVALTKAGTGRLTLSGANTYAGQTTLNGGTLQLGVDNALPSGALVLTSAGTTLDMNGHNDTLSYLSGPASIINNNTTLTVNGAMNAASSQNYNGYSSLAGPISGSGTFAKAGTGALALRADSSSYAGTVSLTGGTLSVGAAPNRLPTSLALAVGSGATFQLDANNQTVSSLTGSGNVNLGGGNLTVNQSGSAAFGGVIRNADLPGSSTSLGHGLRGYYYYNIDLTQLNAVRDDGTVNVSETTLPWGYINNFTKTNQISTRWVGQLLTTVAGAYVFTTRSDDGARLWVNGILTVDSWVLQGATAHSGTNTLAANTRYDIVMEWFNNAGPGSAQLLWTPPGDSTAVIIPSSNLFLPGPGSLVKLGNGVLQLTAANSYSGGTVVSGGTLDATVDAALGAGNVTVGAGASLQLDSSGAIASNADLVLAASAHNVNLNFIGTDDIRALSLDGGATYQSSGTYGASGSGAGTQLAVLSGGGILNVQASPTGTTLTSSPSSPATVGYGSTVTLTATVTGSGALGGTVSFFDGTNILGTSTISSGVATLSVSNLMVTTSPHSLTAVYSGDSTDAKSTSNPVSVTATVATITPIPLVALKLYDGTLTATIASATFTGILPSDTNYVHIASTGYTASFTDPYVGTNKSVSISGMSLSGSLAGNYTLSTTSVASTGTISNRTVTVSGLTVTTKLYDSTTSATVTGTPGLNNVVGADNVNLSGSPTAAFTTKAAGTGQAVTLTGYTIGGTSATNYILVLTNLTGTITATNIPVLGLSGNNKVYDGGTTATLLGSPTAAFFPGDSVSLGGTPVATFATPGVGVGIPITVTGYTLTGADATDYNLSQPTGLSGSITPAATTATITSSLNPSTNGNSVTFTFKVTSTTLTSNAPTGFVTFYTNTVAVSPTVALASITTTSASAFYTTALLPVGTDPVKGVYGGDANFSAPSAPTVNQVVVGPGVCSHTNRVLSVTALGGNSFALNLIGTYQAQYRIVSQTNVAQPLANWLPVFGSTNTVTNASGLWSVTVTNRAPAFFRSQAMSGVCP